MSKQNHFAVSFGKDTDLNFKEFVRWVIGQVSATNNLFIEEQFTGKFWQQNRKCCESHYFQTTSNPEFVQCIKCNSFLPVQ